MGFTSHGYTERSRRLRSRLKGQWNVRRRAEGIAGETLPATPRRATRAPVIRFLTQKLRRDDLKGRGQQTYDGSIYFSIILLSSNTPHEGQNNCSSSNLPANSRIRGLTLVAGKLLIAAALRQSSPSRQNTWRHCVQRTSELALPVTTSRFSCSGCFIQGGAVVDEANHGDFPLRRRQFAGARCL